MLVEALGLTALAIPVIPVIKRMIWLPASQRVFKKTQKAKDRMDRAYKVALSIVANVCSSKKEHVFFTVYPLFPNAEFDRLVADLCIEELHKHHQDKGYVKLYKDKQIISEPIEFIWSPNKENIYR